MVQARCSSPVTFRKGLSVGSSFHKLGHLAPPLGIFIKASFVFILSFIDEMLTIWGCSLQYHCSYMLKKGKLNGQILHKVSLKSLKITFLKQDITKCSYLPITTFLSNTLLFLSYPEEPIIYQQNSKNNLL